MPGRGARVAQRSSHSFVFAWGRIPLAQAVWMTDIRLPSEDPLESPSIGDVPGAGPQHTVLERFQTVLWPIGQLREAAAT